MRNAFQTRILAVALALATLGVCLLAGFNLSQELNTEFPTDGVVWMEAQGGLLADYTRVAQLELNQVTLDDTLAQAEGEIALGLIAVYRSLGGGWQ